MSINTSTHRYTATLIGVEGGPIPLPLPAGSISLDDSRIPHVEANITVPFPTTLTRELYDDPYAPDFGEDAFGEGTLGGVYESFKATPNTALLEKINPRGKRLRVRIVADVATPAYTYQRVFDLAFVDRVIDHNDATVRLELASDEAYLEDIAALDDDYAPQARYRSLRGIVNYVLGKVIPGTAVAWTTTLDYSFAGTDFDPESLIWRAGQSAIDFLSPLLQQAGYRIVCDELRGWTLRGLDYATGGALTLAHGQNLIRAADTISRNADQWFDAAVTRYTWTDRDGVEQTRIDSYARNATPTRVKTFDKRTPFPGTGFSSYVTRRAQRRGRELSVTAVSDWRAHAEMPVTVQLEGAPIQTGVISRLDFDLDRDEMSITARTIDTKPTAWQFIPDGQKWSDRTGPWKKASAT